MRRVNEAVREVLSGRIAAGMRDPRIGFVTVTGVQTSPDLRNATVFVSVLGDEDQQSQTMEGLEDSRKELQAAIAAELRMKNTPRIKFELDHSVERAIHVSELIKEEAQKRGDNEDE
jgi:ribosome-binding factor A